MNIGDNPFRRQTISLGTITPSANIVVERITTAILADFPQVSGHYSRVSVVGSKDSYSGDYDWRGMLDAAVLLGHARPDVILWNGSKGGSIGFDADRDLCARIKALTGRQATTSTLGVEGFFKRDGVKRFGLVTPYAKAYQDKIVEVYGREGYACAAEAHAGRTDNFSYCEIPDSEIAAMVAHVASAKPDSIITYCTNFPAAPLVADLEQRYGVPIYDSVSIGVREALVLAGVDPSPGRRWGSAFTR
ncbi:Asp/Glu/hydantoin racemase [Alsobacter sp. KACC 23698]|uniref:Asp/Glu/hydantoin racemase n=1 Tax=Alsobacter sp. KACC 23698 TaxID=3149229 RepID=A0AAU7JE07_9HYPH